MSDKILHRGAVPGLSCAFCGRSRGKCKALLNSPQLLGISICDKCVRQCIEILMEKGIVKIVKNEPVKKAVVVQ